MKTASRPRWRDALGHPTVASIVAKLQDWLPPLNFITLHYAYFIAVSLISSLIFWGSSSPRFSISYVDSLFLAVSAITEAGLNTVNLSQMTLWQQVLLWLLIILGSTIWVSIWTVLARKHVFEKRFDEIVRADRLRVLKRRATMREMPLLQRIRSIGRVATEPPPNDRMPTTGSKLVAPAAIHDPDLSPIARRSPLPPARLDDEGLVQDEPALQETTASDAEPPSSARGITFAETSRLDHRTTSVNGWESTLRMRHIPSAAGADTDGTEGQGIRWPKILSSRNISRNAQFHGLTSDERERLGGCEYQALKLLAVVVPLYFFLWQFLGGIALGAWIANNLPEAATSNGSNPWFAGIFFAISAFNNSGMALLDMNAIPFERSYFVLLTMGLLILAGNTAYPLFLRLIFWTFLKLLKMTTREETFCEEKATLEFILKYPRRVYTNLFPSRPTWWLFLMLIMLNGIDWLSFEILNLGNPAVEDIPPGPRVVDGLFQALSVRSGGFYVIPIPSLYIGLQVLYVIMMYISVYPVVITMRHSNVYEERSLGIYSDDATPDPDDDESPQRPVERRQTVLGKALKRALTFHGVGVQAPPQLGGESRVSFVGQQIRGQLAHDLWWLVLAVLLISIIETNHFLQDPVTYSVFNVLFEVVSAYACVGISVGLPTQSYSFAGGWYAGSKLILCLVMLRGRHRGLPVALDRAVRLPGERLHQDEEEDYQIRRTMSRRVSMDARLPT
ncbi:TrkH-domain-containing protein [Thozetella sp. PMI_491]|nr:TrkH-domain-containing protein [Thozetella sp. PMI_491]